jgi:DASS family divalent anion:Na+ symporter
MMMTMFKTYATNTNPHFVGSNTKSGFERRKNRIMLKNSSSSLLFGRSATTTSASFCALSKSFSDVGNGGSFDRRFLRRRLHRRRKSDSSWFSLNSSLASGALVPQKKTMDACDEMKSRANNNNTNNKYTISRVLRRGENERRKRAALFLRASAGGDEGEENASLSAGEEQESAEVVVPARNYDDDVDDDEEPNFGVKPPELATFHRKTALFAISVGFAVFYGFPKPDVLTSEAWQLLAIFSATICGLVLKPLPVGAWAFGAMTVSLLTKTLTFDQALSSVSNQVVWLILVTAFFARAFVKTGFGDRLALLFVSVAGQSSLRLAYGFQLAEALLSPAMPSTTARAAGVFIPVIKSLDPRTQEFLIGQQLQGTGATSAFLMSGAAQNFLCMQIAIGMGIPFVNPFNEWAVAAFVPAFICMMVTPLIVFIVDPPLLNATPKAPMEAAKKLQAMGPLAEIEKRMCLSLGTTVFLWIFGAPLGIAAVVAAMTGLCLMLISGVLSWDDALEQKGAWDTLIWFAILIGMSQQLNDLGVIEWLSGFVRDFLISWNLVGTSAFVALHLAYFLSHYMFASQSAHVGALYGAFLTMMIAGGVPPKLAAISLAMNTNTFGGLTHYASGQAAVYYGSGKIGLEKLWKQGLYVSCVHAFIWSTVGMAWWSVCGIF